MPTDTPNSSPTPPLTHPTPPHSPPRRGAAAAACGAEPGSSGRRHIRCPAGHSRASGAAGGSSQVNGVRYARRAWLWQRGGRHRSAGGRGLLGGSGAIEAQLCAYASCSGREQRLPRCRPADLAPAPRSLLQVISPMRKGPAGTATLNPMLQALLNPPRPGKAELLRHASAAHAAAAASTTSSSDDAGSSSSGGLISAAAHQEAKVFRVGDRVIQQVGKRWPVSSSSRDGCEAFQQGHSMARCNRQCAHPTACCQPLGAAAVHGNPTLTRHPRPLGRSTTTTRTCSMATRARCAACPAALDLHCNFDFQIASDA